MQRWFLALLNLVLFVLLLVSCELTESQDPRDVFKNGKLPPFLFRLANQIHEIRNYDQIVKRVLNDKKRSGELLKTAVIDNGIDVSNPDLVNKIDFKVENNKIVGIGLDIMGGDGFVSSNLIKASLFAFGAKGIEDGKIADPPGHPLELLGKYNDEFMDGLIQRIQSDPELSKSLFSKITKDSMTIMGSLKVFSAEEKFGAFSDKSYQERKERKILIGPDIREHIKAGKKNKDKLMLRDFPYALDLPWKMALPTGLPAFDGEYGRNAIGDLGLSMSRFEGADKFFKLLKAWYSEYTKKSGFEDAFEQYQKFLDGRDFNPSTTKAARMEQAAENLQKALYYKMYGPKVYDPLYTFNSKLTKAVIQNMDESQFVEPLKAISLETKVKVLQESLDFLEDYLKYVDLHEESSVTGKRAFRDFMERRGVIRELLEWYLKDRRWTENHENLAKQSPKEASAYRRRLSRLHNPFISENSKNSTHGTHTSGTVAIQHDNIRIVPVRITTASTQTSKEQRLEMQKVFKKRFQDWLAEPAVYRALAEQFKENFADIDLTDESATTKRAFAKKIMGLLDEKINLSIEKQPLDFLFIGQLEESIKYVGQNKIKIASISLGAEFEKAPIFKKDKNLTENLENFFEFLKYEFFKYQIANTVEKEAAHTLFVIAAGNSGKWVDGKSRSALPVDLSSPFLEEFENAAKGEFAPNNHLKNILGVGSLNAAEDLSAFTNIPIGTKTPFVLAHGENILSPVRVLDPSIIEQAFKEQIGTFSTAVPLLDINDERFLTYLKHTGILKDGLSVEEVAKIKLRNVYRSMFLSSIFSNFEEAIQLHLAISYPNHLAKLSGTSMATPTVAGIVGKMIIEKAQKLNLPLDQIYEHPEFTPEKILDDVFAKAEPLFKNRRAITLYKLIGEATYKPSKGQQDLEKFLKGIVERGKANNSFLPTLGKIHLPACIPGFSAFNPSKRF